MDDVSVIASPGHEEGVDMSLPKQTGHGGDGRWDIEVFGLAQLTLVTSPDVPTDVLAEAGPPKTKKEVGRCRESSLVAEVVVGKPNEA
jgi:hypothetical protein